MVVSILSEDSVRLKLDGTDTYNCISASVSILSEDSVRLKDSSVPTETVKLLRFNPQ